MLWLCRFQSNAAAPAIRSRRATPPTAPPTIAPILVDDFFFSVIGDAETVETDGSPEGEDGDDEVRAGIPFRVREEAVDEDGVGVGVVEEVFGFVVLVRESAAEELCK